MENLVDDMALNSVRFVHDADTDIMKNEYLDEMRVGVAGRKMFQKIFISNAPSGKKYSTLKYDPTTDAPASPLSILPTAEETEGRPNTSEYLVVGLVLADDPRKFSTVGTGLSRSK